MLRCCEGFLLERELLRVRFGDCVFDGSAHELRRAGQPVHLPPKAFRLLELLISKRPRAVMKAEIRDALWPATSSPTRASRGWSSIAIGDRRRRAAPPPAAHGPRLRLLFFGGDRAGAGSRPRAARSLGLSARPGRARNRARRGGARPRPAAGRQRLDRLHQRVSPSRPDRRFGGAGHARRPREQERDLPPGNEADVPSELMDGDVIAIGSVVLTFRAARAAVSTKTASPAGRDEGGAPLRR